MKSMVIFNITNIALMTSWHSGSASSDYAELGFETREHAELFASIVKHQLEKIDSDDPDKGYRVDYLILSYDKKDKEKIAEFYKYKQFHNTWYWRQEVAPCVQEDLLPQERETERE